MILAVLVTILRQECQLWLLIALVEGALTMEVGQISVHALKEVGIRLRPQFVIGLQPTGSLPAPQLIVPVCTEGGGGVSMLETCVHLHVWG